MKTTIDLPEALAQEARALATRERISLRELVVAGLRAEIARRKEPAKVHFVFPTAGGHGLRPEVDPGRVTEMAYDLRS